MPSLKDYFAASLPLGRTALTTEVVALTPVEMTATVPETAASAMLSTVQPLVKRLSSAIKVHKRQVRMTRGV